MRNDVIQRVDRENRCIGLLCTVSPEPKKPRNSPGEEIANVNFLYDDIVHALETQ